MDNFHIDVVSKGREQLERALGVAFFDHNGGAAGYMIERAPVNDHAAEKEYGKPDWRRGVPKDRDRLIFAWGGQADGSKPYTPFPFKADVKFCADFAEKWLSNTDYTDQPDHDGDNGKGFRVYTTDWGFVDGHRYAICAVEPAWAMYGK